MGLNNKHQLIGKTFGKWTVLEQGESKNGQSRWLCRCGCPAGTERLVYGGRLVSGRSTSCGCGVKDSSRVVDGQKLCSNCKTLQSIENFYANGPGRLTSHCKSCSSEKHKLKYEKYKDKIKLRTKQWAADNPEKVKAQNKLYRHLNQAKVSEAQKKWRQENKEELKVKQHVAYLKSKESGKHLEQGRKWRKNNREKCRAASRKHDAKPESKAKRKIYNKWYKETFPDKFNASRTNWRINNPEKSRNVVRRRRARIAQLDGSGISAEQIAELRARFGHRCLWCEKHESEVGTLHADHVIPVVKKGLHDITNIQMLCKNCNRKKGTKILDFRWKLDVQSASGF